MREINMKFCKNSVLKKTPNLKYYDLITGAFVAGLDAGLTYNTWPKMADRWVPDDLWALAPRWKNVFENATTVQFNHRYLVCCDFSKEYELGEQGCWETDNSVYVSNLIRLLTRVVFLCTISVLQIGRCKRDNLGIIFHITILKHML